MDINYFKRTFKFSEDTSIPLYEQLTSYIKIQIQAGVLKPGDKMITENELCEILNVSRTTVRQSMNKLVEQKFIYRYRGKGSFIADQKVKQAINYLYNFTEDMRKLGTVPSSIVLKSEVVNLEEGGIRQSLRMPESHSTVFHLARLRCADGVPMLFENTYIPYYLCNGIEQYDFSNVSLYHTLSGQYGLNLYHAKETIEAIVLEKSDAELLQCKPKSAGYKIQRVSNLDSGYVYEYTSSVTISDRCAFEVDLYQNTSSNKSSVDFHWRTSAE